ncbi:MAG: SET domain-containing protein-lysine N-methyltransferase [Deltaproteobacteria bacterium]|nr:MAG: SET domain-containing protein-lysine N-methyltransferase [Deltaproteobacteria bacterium]
MPRMDGLEVYLSSIHGYGVRATRPFFKGDIVVVGDGVLYREDDDFDDEYALIVPGYLPNPDGSEGPPLYYDLTDQTRWINHSCDPNTEVDIKWNSELQVAIPWWTALRDIQPGEELTYDYAFAGHLAIPCHCGAPTCRGLIVDPDEAHLVPDELRHLLRGELAEFAQRAG